MKKVLALVLTLVLVSSAFAIAPVNHNATLIPAKTSLLSGGVAETLTGLSLEYTLGMSKTNLHAKIVMLNRNYTFEGLLHHYLFNWNDIAMGFTYGGEAEFSTRRFQISPVGMWNMSYELADNVSFYGGLKYQIDFGTSWGTAFVDHDMNLYLGTQIDVAKKLEVYLEVQPALWNSATWGFIGVNYYLGNKSLKDGLNVE
jgi:hypothetical protein